MKKHILSAVLVAAVLCLLVTSVFASGTGFHAGLTITRTETSIRVTVVHSEVFASHAVKLTIPTEMDWTSAKVTFEETGDVLERVTWNAADRSVTFPVASGGTYIIEGERASVIDKTPGWGSLPAGDPIPMMEFTDVKRSDWFYEEVRFVFGRELMNGVSSDRFAPHDTLTRAMVVQVLYNMAGRPDCGSEAFADVDANDWYYDAVAWAAAENIVTGVTADTFAPMAPVTREELAAMLFRYAVANGLEAVSTVEYLNAYPDAAAVSEWAVSAVNWAVGQGLINGINGKLLPGGSATRAQTAAILMRYCQ